MLVTDECTNSDFYDQEGDILPDNGDYDDSAGENVC